MPGGTYLSVLGKKERKNPPEGRGRGGTHGERKVLDPKRYFVLFDRFRSAYPGRWISYDKVVGVTPRRIAFSGFVT